MDSWRSIGTLVVQPTRFVFLFNFGLNSVLNLFLLIGSCQWVRAEVKQLTLGCEGGKGKANAAQSFHVFPPSNTQHTKAFVVGVEGEVSPCQCAAIKHEAFGLWWSNTEWGGQTVTVGQEQQVNLSLVYQAGLQSKVIIWHFASNFYKLN